MYVLCLFYLQGNVPMDRKGQLRNVAFGGDWAEMIEPRERLAEAFDVIDNAVRRTADEDLRLDTDVAEAVRFAADFGMKGSELVLAWDRALDVHYPEIRQAELKRIARLFRSGSAIG